MHQKLLRVTTFDSQEKFEIDAQKIVRLWANVGATAVYMDDGDTHLVDEDAWVVQSAIHELTGRLIHID